MGTYQSGKGTEIEEENGRVETEGDDEFDVQMMQAIHMQNKLREEEQKKAFGVSHNIFDVSSYGEVHMKKFIAQSNQEQNEGGNTPYKTNVQTYDQSVSLVQMQDSMLFDDLKAPNKKGLLPTQAVIPEETHEEQPSGKFDTSAEMESSENKHYMFQNQMQQSAKQHHYYEMMNTESLP